MAENKLLLSRAKSAVLSRDYDFAARLYKQMLGESPDDESLLLELGSVYSKGGKDAQALSVYQKIAQINPENTEALMALSAIYRRTRNYDQSVKMLEKARSIDGKNMQIVYNLGFTYKSMGKYDDAIACFEDVIDQNPNDVLAYNHIGSIYAEQGDHETAISSYLRALKVDSNHPIIQLNLAKSYEATGETEKALTAYENSLRAKPGWLEAVGGYSDLLLKLDRVHEAYAVLRNAVAINPKDARTHTQLGHVFYRQSIFEDAKKEYTTALECDSKYDPALVGLADTQENMNAHAEASRTIRRAEEIRPDDPVITKKAAHIMLSASEYSDAFDRISRLREQNPKDVQALSLLGQYYICNGEWDKVEDCYRQIAEYDPTYSEHYRDGAKRFNQKGDEAQAEKYLRMALEKNPRDVSAMNSLAELLEKAQKGKEAFELYKQAQNTDSLNQMTKSAVSRLETKYGIVEISEYVPPEKQVAADAQSAQASQGGFAGGVRGVPVMLVPAAPGAFDALFDQEWVDVPRTAHTNTAPAAAAAPIDDIVVPAEDEEEPKPTRPLSSMEQTVFDASSLQGLIEDEEPEPVRAPAYTADDEEEKSEQPAVQSAAFKEHVQSASESAMKAEYAAQQAWDAAQIAADSAQAVDALRTSIAESEDLPQSDSPEVQALRQQANEMLGNIENPLELFQKLRGLCEYLPPEHYDTFMSSRTRLLLEYVIARLSGEAGLLQKAMLRREELMQGADFAASSENAAENEDGIELVTHVVDDVLTLIQDVPEKNLRVAMENATKGLVEKIITQ